MLGLHSHHYRNISYYWFLFYTLLSIIYEYCVNMPHYCYRNTHCVSLHIVKISHGPIWQTRYQYTQANQLEGSGHRIVAAQQQAWKALIMYAAALLTTQLTGLDLAAIAAIATASVIFIAAQIAHGVFMSPVWHRCVH